MRKNHTKVLAIVTLPFMPDDYVGPAQHYYPKGFWKKVFGRTNLKDLFFRYLKDDYYPDDLYRLDNIIGSVKKYDEKKSTVTIYVLDTPCGRILKELLDEGYSVWVYPNGQGNLLPANINVVYENTTYKAPSCGVVDVDDYGLLCLYPKIFYSDSCIKKRLENETNCTNAE